MKVDRLPLRAVKRLSDAERLALDKLDRYIEERGT